MGEAKHIMRTQGTKHQSTDDVDGTIDRISAILEDAGQTILLFAFRQANKLVDHKKDGSVVTETDITCQHRIRRELFNIWPETGFIGEEMGAAEQQACLEKGGRFWCLDPLDGTTNFVTSFPAFAVSLALVEDGLPVLACIHDPVRRETFSAMRGRGARLNGNKIRAYAVDALSDAVGFIDFKRLDAIQMSHFTLPGLYRSQRNIGSCALEWAWLAAGRAQFIVHGGQRIWDYAGGSLIAAEAGCTVTDFAGCSPFLPVDLTSSIAAAASGRLHHSLLQHIKR